MSYIHSIATALPDYELPQMEALDFMQYFFACDEVEKRRLTALYERSGIERRYSVVPDYNRKLNQQQLFKNTTQYEPFPSVEKRMEIYASESVKLALEAVKQLTYSDIQLSSITHLITISCTGMSAPGLDLALMEHLQLKPSVPRTSVNFMGCYAAVHGLKLAHAICQSNKQAQVLLVSVELCSLHFQKTFDYDNVTASAIFSDGAAACLVCGDEVKYNSPKNIRIHDFYSEVFFEGKKDMAWQIANTGFLMTLSSYIPSLVQQNIDALLGRAMAHYQTSKPEINLWAIHPGGRKILEAIASQLQLQPSDLTYSYEVLKNYGNMSSATILFVLKNMMEQNDVHGKILGAAFGPGLTMETFLMEKTSV
jgi:predicted naringenin-chalcone synthase